MVGKDSDAKVVIKIDINDREANQKLRNLNQKMRDLDKKNRTSSKSLDDVGKSLEKTAKKAKDADDKFNWFGRRLNQLEKELKGTGTAFKAFGAALGGIFKILKMGAMEFGAMTVALGAMSLAFKTGQILARGWAKAVSLAGGAAGVAVAAISTVLGAIRELQVAQMKPLYTGPRTASDDASGILGNKRLAMYKDSLGAIMSEQMKATGRIDSEFQQRLTRMGDFAGGDPKQLQAIAAAFSEMEKKGKVTADVYSALKSASPALGKAFEELAGGEKKAAGAAASGSVSFREFEKALYEGKLKALAPYNGALEAINNTLIGRLKGTLTTVKEDLTDLGVGFLDMMKGPLAQVERDIKTFILKITPTVRNVFPQLFGQVANDAEGLLGGVLNKLATSIITNMPKLVGMGQQMAETWGRFKDLLSQVGDYLGRAVAPFHTLYVSILKPLGQEIATTLNYALQSFSAMVSSNSSSLATWGQSLHGIFAGLRGLIDLINTLKKLIQPFVTGLLKMMSLFGQIFKENNPLSGFFKTLATIGILLLVFKKFITALGQVKQNANSFGQILKNVWAGEDLTKKSTDAAAQAAERQTAAVNAQTAAMERLLVVMEEVLLIQRQMAGLKPGQIMGLNGPEYPMYGPPKPTGGGGGKPAEKMGKAMGKGFADSKTGKAIVGGAVAMGFIGPMLGTYISSRNSATSNGAQAAAGALSMGGTGAALGATFGPWGALAGGVGGAIIGGLTGWFGANKERERQRAQGRQAAQDQIANALGSGNRASDYTNAFAAQTKGLAELELMKGAGQDKIRSLESQKKTATDKVMGDFTTYLQNKMLKEGKLEQGQQLHFLYSGESLGIGNDAYGKERTNEGRDQFVIKGTDKSVGDVEANYIEDAAAQFAVASGLMNSIDEAHRQMSGRGGGKNAFFLKDLVGGDFDAQIAATNKELEDLKAKYGDAGAATNQYAQELEKIRTKEKRFTENMRFATDDLGLSADDVSAKFDELGFSLGETGVGVHEFIKILGYTGDAAADAALAMGRMRDQLLGPIDAIKNQAEQANRYEEQLSNLLEMRGKPTDQRTADVTVADTMTALVDKTMSEVQTGAVSFKDAFGGKNDFGTFGNQLQAIIDQSPDLPPEVLAALRTQKSILEQRVTEAKTDPFARAQFDAGFATEFEKAVQTATTAATAAMQNDPNLNPADAMSTAAEGLRGFLASQGIEMSDETKAKLADMIGNTALNSSEAIISASGQGAQMFYDKIRSAITGVAIPVAGTNTGPGPRGNRFTAGVNDTRTSRFQRTMQTHAALNGRFGGRRTVTSGMRDWNLGSLNSDHATGGAFDLTGDNLLAYGKAVRDSGGFAEIHGGTGDRHLHVVPGVGDTYAPQPVAARQAANFSAAPAGPITVNVYGSEGQSVQALADEVMDRLERKQRSNSERS